MNREDEDDVALRPIESLVPHSGAMCLLDRVLECGDEHLVAEVTVPVQGLFSDSQGPGTGVGAWVGIEYMAQAVAAWAGAQERAKGEAPKIGFLLGSRRYQCTVARFEQGQVLRVEIARQFQADNGLGQFDCRILAQDQLLAQAQLTVFGPPDPVQFLNGEE